MEILDYYITLHLQHPNLKDDRPAEVTVSQLESLFYCTKRNVNLLLKRMSEEKWITWVPGKGRGNRSKVLFHYDLEEAAEAYFSKLLAKNQIAEAAEFIKRPLLPEYLAQKLQMRMQNNFGLQVKQTVSSSMDLLKIPMRRPLAALDPAFSYTAAEAHFVRQIFDTLNNYNSATGAFEPHLAHHWEVNSEYTKWTFFLRKSVRFHHGRNLTSQDVKYTLERLKDPAVQSPFRHLFSEIQSIEAFHEYGVTIMLKRPNVFFLHYLSSYNAAILPQDVPLVTGRELIGTGPFKVTEYNDRVFVLEAFDDHFNGRPLLDRVELWFVELDYDRIVDYELPGSGTTKNRYMKVNNTGSRYIVFNFQREGPHHDLYFRQAIHELIDPSQLISDLGGRRSSPASSFWPERSEQSAFSPSSLSRARSLLNKSTYNGKVLTFNYQNYTNEGLREAKWIQNRFREAGIYVNPVPYSLLDSEELDGEMISKGEVLERDAQYGFLSFLKGERSMRSLLTSEQLGILDHYLEQFLQEESYDTREEIIDSIETYLFNEKILLHLYHIAKEWNYPALLKGVHLNDFGWADFRTLWVKPEINKTT
ncbi:ABC transporter substrate-binding protein [Fictibacillus fluitans]|uniref:ABC transporter substrate-binding protein n=1 Tax=Fictibacillus fluitans TaxID=3058422 RepID=A0ABT8HZY1_9BACL|nr:ABC transporter substrate-binding protein [Fictibacillus sp. NE201]MDN4526040.1 ABC transporter substrate-binding protein [Fictibacillus sp. NE201]